jgi:hypothetical protein
MTQADSVHSTPPTNTSLTRRNMIGAMATVGAAAIATAAPAIAGLAEPDPIFAAIEAHRKAYATMQTIFAEHRQAHEVADAKVGPSEIEIPSMVEPGKTVEASYWLDIERAIPCEQYPDLNAHHNRLLDERTAAHAAIVESLIGDEDEATAEVCGPELDARDAFAETVPTTLPGLLAMIVYAGNVVEHDAEAFADSNCPLIDNLAIAAKALIKGGGNERYCPVPGCRAQAGSSHRSPDHGKRNGQASIRSIS